MSGLHRALFTKLGVPFIKGIVIGVIWDNGKENGSCYLGFRVCPVLFSVNIIQVACVSYLKFSELPVAFCKGLDLEALGVLQGMCKCISYICLHIYVSIHTNTYMQFRAIHTNPKPYPTLSNAVVPALLLIFCPLDSLLLYPKPQTWKSSSHLLFQHL